MSLRLLLISVILVGCSATMVKEPGSNSPYAPMNADELTGIVKYLNQGASSVVRARREDAYEKMYAACKGYYEIVIEGPRVEGGIVFAADNALYISNTEYWYIQFRCLRSPDR